MRDMSSKKPAPKNALLACSPRTDRRRIASEASATNPPSTLMTWIERDDERVVGTIRSSAVCHRVVGCCRVRRRRWMNRIRSMSKIITILLATATEGEKWKTRLAFAKAERQKRARLQIRMRVSPTPINTPIRLAIVIVGIHSLSRRMMHR